MEASAPGFKMFVQPDFQVQVNDNRRFDINLEIGDVSQEITVEADIASDDCSVYVKCRCPGGQNGNSG